MGAPVAVAATLAKTRIGRKIAIGILAVIALAVALVVTPLVAVPFALAGSAATGAVANGPAPAEPPAMGTVTSGKWQYPLHGDYFKGRGFGYHPINGCSFCTRYHEGYDMARACGTTVHAAGPGRVITAGQYEGYGNAVRIDHGHGIQTIYGHMMWGSLRVRVGQLVAAGTPLGAEGDTGNSVGCHLHFEVRKNGTPIDPQPFMAALGLPLK